MRQLRRNGSSPNEVRLLAQKFHLLVRQYSKLVKEATLEMSANQMRKECHRDIHKFAHKILDDDSDTSIQPSFGRDQAEDFFCRVYLASPKAFIHPEWMPECPQPVVPMITTPLTEEELSGVISGLKSSSVPSPVDQIPCTIIKRCPSLIKLVACIDSLVQLLLAYPENPYSMEGWYCASAGQEEGSQRPLQSLQFLPYVPDIMCDQGVHQLGEEEMASPHGQQWLPQHCHPESR